MIADLHPVERPREKLARLNAEALSDRELLALVLRTGYFGRDVVEVSDEILSSHPCLNRLSFGELSRIKGVGPTRAASLVAAFELARRDRARDLRPVLDTPERVLERIPAAVRAGRKEHFVAFYLNARNQLLQYETVSIGTLSASLVHPREVFSPAIAQSAAALIVAHNHPSGDSTPSAEDRDATRRLCRAGELLGIPLLDHLIVADGSFYSFKEHGILS